jgi:hypothetical protein
MMTLICWLFGHKYWRWGGSNINPETRNESVVYEWMPFCVRCEHKNPNYPLTQEKGPSP